MCKCDDYRNYCLETDEEDLIEMDDDEIFSREQERLAECICGAWQWSQKKGEFVHVADCVCGRT